MAEVIAVRRLRRKRLIIKTSWHLKDLSNPFEQPEDEFVNKFRLSKEAARHLITEVRKYIDVRSGGYSVEFQVLNTLRVLGTGSFQNVIGDTTASQASQAYISKSIDRVLDAIMNISSSYIGYPTEPVNISKIRANFFRKFGFPNTIGAIDCTHICIKKPTTSDWFVYLNRKYKFSVNVQMVCDADMTILDVVARWPGSAHDSYIWSLSGLRHMFASSILPENSFLLGDSGYPLEPWLMTPYLDASCPREILFNEKHRKCRNVIERCFGLLKSRFRSLHESGGTLLYSPNKVCKIIIAACVLHNICKKFNVEEPQVELNFQPDEDIPEYNNSSGRASRIRDDIASRFQAAL